MGAKRLDRVRELIKRELGEIIRRELPVEEVGIITINHIDISPDLHSAAVFISTIGSDEQKKKSLRKLHTRTRLLQSRLAGAIVLKHSPKLRFFTDDSIQQGDKVLQILDELKEEIGDSDDEDPDNY